jgi:N-acylneuraminate cytidylyltransferase
MKTVAFIPARGGSKSIPLKNIRPFCGMPLLYWAANAACGCDGIDEVCVATDSDRIRGAAEGLGLRKLRVMGRSPGSATDEASTESAMIEFAESEDFETIVLIQATSPLLASEDLDRGLLAYRESGACSALSAVRQKRFIWREAGGFFLPENYDAGSRPRRQDFGGYLVENGAYYITSRRRLLESRSRLSGSVIAVEMPEDTYVELDEPSDWVVAEALMRARRGTPKGKARIRLALADCDGVLTDGGMYYSESEGELKRFSAIDGMGAQLLKEAGIITGVVTGEESEAARRRAVKLGMGIVEIGIKNKAECVRRLSREYGIPLEEIAFLGDDINDIDVIKMVGFGACVANAHRKVKEVAQHITAKSGGNGAYREFAEHLISREKDS